MRNELIVYSPNPEVNIFNSKRFLISINQLEKYIGPKNAFTARLKIANTKMDKTTIKFRKFGKLEIYLK